MRGLARTFVAAASAAENGSSAVGAVFTRYPPSATALFKSTVIATDVRVVCQCREIVVERVSCVRCWQRRTLRCSSTSSPTRCSGLVIATLTRATGSPASWWQWRTHVRGRLFVVVFVMTLWLVCILPSTLSLLLCVCACVCLCVYAYVCVLADPVVTLIADWSWYKYLYNGCKDNRTSKFVCFFIAFFFHILFFGLGAVGVPQVAMSGVMTMVGGTSVHIARGIRWAPPWRRYWELNYQYSACSIPACPCETHRGSSVSAVEVLLPPIT